MGIYGLRARYLNPNTGRFWTMDSYEGSPSDPLSLHKYLYAHADPVMMVDPSGHDGTAAGSVSTTGVMGVMARTLLPAVNNAYWSAIARVTPIVNWAMHKYFWAEIIAAYAGVAAMIAPEVLNLAADLGTRINRAYTLNTIDIPAAPGGPNGYGITIENIGGQQLEAMGGRSLGGNVRGTDGTLDVGPGNALASFKAHDVVY